MIWHAPYTNLTIMKCSISWKVNREFSNSWGKSQFIISIITVKRHLGTLKMLGLAKFSVVTCLNLLIRLQITLRNKCHRVKIPCMIKFALAKSKSKKVAVSSRLKMWELASKLSKIFIFLSRRDPKIVLKDSLKSSWLRRIIWSRRLITKIKSADLRSQF